ncbi:MAG TPA: hypothetical protein VNY29_04475 [Terriglobales bacterium]|nr:hypothetical protein [Terriglobales bacterium]
MKLHHIVCLSALLALPNLALAKLPPNSALGQVEGTLDFWAQIDPLSAAKDHQFKKVLLQGEPEKDVAEARASSEYKSAYNAIGEALGQAPKDKAIKACTSLVEGKT